MPLRVMAHFAGNLSFIELYELQRHEERGELSFYDELYGV